MEEVVRVENVWMMFHLSREGEERFKEYAINLMRGKLHFQRFWALKGISFQMKKGESLGIVGLNGSGKSTLLKLVAGIMTPTVGTVQTKGLLAPLLELGGGFDGNATARENIFFTGAMYGLPRSFVEQRFDDIIAFSELEQFVDVPVKNFSSGMRSRLGFAIATIVEPEILILDEVLSVGDASFRKKSEDRLQKIIKSGVTLLFVSHSAGQVEKLCEKALWIDRGHMRMYGPSKEVCAAYKKYSVELSAKKTAQMQKQD